MKSKQTLTAAVIAIGVAVAGLAAAAPASPVPANPLPAKAVAPSHTGQAEVILVKKGYGHRRYYRPKRAVKRQVRREVRREVRRDIRQDRRQFRRDYRHKYGVPRAYVKPRAVKPRYYGKVYKPVPRYRIGGKFPHRIRRHFVAKPYVYGLHAPKHGYGWVRYDRDFYLVALGTGLIVKALLY